MERCARPIGGGGSEAAGGGGGGGGRNRLRALGGGGRVAGGGLAVARDDDVRLRGIVASPDGALVYRGDAMGSDPDEVGERLAQDLLKQGAEVVLGEVRGAEVRRTSAGGER